MPASATRKSTGLIARLAEVLRLLHETTDQKIRRHLGIALLLVVSGALLSALAPLALKAMVDAVTGLSGSGSAAADRSALLAGVAYLAAVGSARVLADIRPLLIESADHRLHSRLTDRYFRHLLGLPLATLLGRRSGEWPHSLELATLGFKLIVAQAVNSLVPVVVEIAAMAIVLMHLGQGGLVAVFLATAAAYLAIFGWSAASLMRRARGVSTASLSLHAHLNDTLQHIEVLRSFAAEASVTRRLRTACEDREQSWLRVNRLRTGLGLAATTTFALSLTASLLLARTAVTDGSLSVGGFVLVTVYMLQMVRPLEMLGGAARDIAQSLGLVRPVIDILRQPAQEPAPDAATRSAKSGQRPQGASIEFENLVFGYAPDQPVLRRVNLVVPAGRTLAIVGASGSGKSSIGRLLLRLYEPQRGCIRLDGYPLETLPLGVLRRRIGLVPQDTALFHDSIANNIRLGRPDAGRDEVVCAARCAQLHDFIAALPEAYDTMVGERGLRLSGGERQRIAIARALLLRPDIYVFDEATSMLDTDTERALMERLQEYTAGCTVLVIAHRLGTVMRADEIVVLDGGQVVERGGHAPLLAANGHYARLWRQQAPEHV